MSPAASRVRAAVANMLDAAAPYVDDDGMRDAMVRNLAMVLDLTKGEDLGAVERAVAHYRLKFGLDLSNARAKALVEALERAWGGTEEEGR